VTVVTLPCMKIATFPFSCRKRAASVPPFWGPPGGRPGGAGADGGGLGHHRTRYDPRSVQTRNSCLSFCRKQEHDLAQGVRPGGVDPDLSQTLPRRQTHLEEADLCGGGQGARLVCRRQRRTAEAHRLDQSHSAVRPIRHRFLWSHQVRHRRPAGDLHQRGGVHEVDTRQPGVTGDTVLVDKDCSGAVSFR
jgi:hypothetical protein